jgi:hypothetical protein
MADVSTGFSALIFRTKKSKSVTPTSKRLIEEQKCIQTNNFKKFVPNICDSKINEIMRDCGLN